MAHQRSLTGPLALLVIGALLLLRNLGYLPASLDQWWPVILIISGVWLLIARSAPGETGPSQALSPATPPAGQAPPTERRHHASTGGLILVGLGVALLASNLIGGRSAGALILMAIGLALLIARIW